MDIQAVREKDIKKYLSSLGIDPVKITSRNYIYLSPWRGEQEPSLYVKVHDNFFKDFGDGSCGNIIDLVILLHKTDFKGALKILRGGRAEYIPKFESPGRPPKKGTEIVSLNELTDSVLIKYLRRRGIPFWLARRYLKQADFRFPEGKAGGMIFRAVAFMGDSGGAELRSEWVKVSSSPKNITTFPGKNNHLNIFEGFMDFLSALVYFKKERFEHKTIVLNSLSYLTTLIPVLKEAEKVYLFIDNDKPANKRIEILKGEGINISDERWRFAGNGGTSFTDFNEFLVNYFANQK